MYAAETMCIWSKDDQTYVCSKGSCWRKYDEQTRIELDKKEWNKSHKSTKIKMEKRMANIEMGRRRKKDQNGIE